MAVRLCLLPRSSWGHALVLFLFCCGLAEGQSGVNLLAPPPRQPSASAAPPQAADRPPTLLTTPPVSGPITAPAPEAQRTGASSSPAQPREASPYAADNRSGLRVTKGSGVLPNDHGQVWREYDISPYTGKASDVVRPEQTIVDWILRDTGTEVWFGEPLGILSANSSTLRVYHTPEMHERVRALVERFVAGESETHALALRMMTVSSPNWRAQAVSLLKPVDVKSPGLEAWLLSRENAVLLFEQLKARSDFREHIAPTTEVANGQLRKLSRTQARSYVRSVQLKREFPFYDMVPGKIDEGYSLEVSPLMTLDGRIMEAAITCRIDQIEKLLPLAIDVPIGNQSQRVQIQVPQMASWRLAERFRWPADEVLLLSCGVVASPSPTASGPLSILAPLGFAGNRADALLMLEHRSPGAASLASIPSARPAPNTKSTAK